MLKTCSMIALLAVAVPVFAFADDQRDRRLRGNRDSQQQARRPVVDRPNVSRFFTMLDKDRDGELSQSEMDLAIAVLRSLDANRNGSVSVSEFTSQRSLRDQPKDGDRSPESDKLSDSKQRDGSDRPRFGQRDGDSAMSLERLVKFADKDGDGAISLEEAPERLKRVFDRVDANSDGKLDSSELGKLRDRFSAAMKSRSREADAEIGGQRPKRPE